MRKKNDFKLFSVCALLSEILLQSCHLAEALVRDLGEAALHKPSALPLEPPVVNNYRVKDLDAAEEAPSEEEFEEDLEEEVVEREALKKQSGTILDRATKGRKKKRGGKKEAS